MVLTESTSGVRVSISLEALISTVNGKSFTVNLADIKKYSEKKIYLPASFNSIISPVFTL